ncbi:MAG: large subunit ribosomal protein L13 [Microgenomates group bacterium Gr01-1014_5]|nr:MAG: large subunit ribosomal protein L13 [Microgenomates group bacterium Gr01-1014_5]
MNNTTYSPKAAEIVRGWHLIDAKGLVLGRMSTGIAGFLIGKHKKTYSANIDSGDFVVVVNAAQVKVTGRKEEQKTYWRHSGYPGGLKSTTLKVLRQTRPAKIIEEAVWNMLPKNRLRKQRFARLKVYAEENHPYKDKVTSKQ